MVKKKCEDLRDETLTVPEAAKMKGVTESRIYQWISEARLTKHIDERFGRTLVSRSELESLQYLRRGRPKKIVKTMEKKSSRK